MRVNDNFKLLFHFSNVTLEFIKLFNKRIGARRVREIRRRDGNINS